MQKKNAHIGILYQSILLVLILYKKTERWQTHIANCVAVTNK